MTDEFGNEIIPETVADGTPSVDVPAAGVADVDVPGADVPDVDVPDVAAADTEVPAADALDVSAPAGDAPAADAPAEGMPAASWEPVGMDAPAAPVFNAEGDTEVPWYMKAAAEEKGTDPASYEASHMPKDPFAAFLSEPIDKKEGASGKESDPYAASRADAARIREQFRQMHASNQERNAAFGRGTREQAQAGSAGEQFGAGPQGGVGQQFGAGAQANAGQQFGAGPQAGSGAAGAYGQAPRAPWEAQGQTASAQSGWSQTGPGKTGPAPKSYSPYPDSVYVPRSENAGGAYGQAWPNTVTPKPSQGFGIAGMVCGILSILCCVLGIGSVFLGIAGVVLSVLAMQRKQDKGFWLTGMITGGIGILLGLIITAFIILGAVRGAGSGAYVVPYGEEFFDEFDEFGDIEDFYRFRQ